MTAPTKRDVGLGPLYVALGNGSTPAEPLYLLVKHDHSSSYLPAWHSEVEAKRYIESKAKGEAVPTLLTRAGFEWTRKFCSNLGVQLFLKVGDV